MVVTKVDGVSGDWDGEGKMKKGTWTADEDAILLEYVRSHGEGNWNAVRKNSGLRRCGKSCRLRWANHLRPNLKKGSFSPEEERIVVELHARFGNKWARMASMLPGRTDNEIKNYWNTRMKKRRRQRLPLYSDQHQHVHPFISAPTTPTTTEAAPITLPFQSYNFHQNPQPNSSFSPSDNSTTFSFQCPATPILSHPVAFKRFRRSGSDSLLPPLSTDIPTTTSFEYNDLHILRNQHPLGQTTFPRFPLSSSSCQLSDPGLGHCEFKPSPNRFLPTPSLPPKAPSLPLLDFNTMGFDVNAELSNSRKRSRASTNPNSSFVVDHDSDELLEDLLAESCHGQTLIASQDENVRLQQQLLHPLPLGSNNFGYWGTSPPMVSQLEGMHGIKNNNEASHMHLPYEGSEKAMGNTNNQENIDEINSTDSGDLTKLLSFFPTSLEIPEWFSCSTSGDTSKAQSSPDEPVYVMGFDRTQEPAAESWNNLPEFC